MDGPNLYAYVNQNPWTKFDPLGLAERFSREYWKNIYDHLTVGVVHLAKNPEIFVETATSEEGKEAFKNGMKMEAMSRINPLNRLTGKKRTLNSKHNKNSVDSNNGTNLTPRDGDPTPISAKDQMKKNQADGKRREEQVQNDLKNENPDASVQREQYLRDENGQIVKDPLTGEARRVDHAVIDKEKASAQTVETTGTNVDKTKQLEKEQRIREQGGTYVRDRETRDVVPVKDVSEVRKLD